MKKPQVVVIDDAESSRRALVQQLVGQGHVIEAVDLSRGADAVAELRPHVVVVGPSLAAEDAPDYLTRVRGIAGARTALIVTPAEVDTDSIVECLEAGADQVLPWDAHAGALAMVVTRSLEKATLARAVERARRGVVDGLSVGQVGEVIGAHPTMQALLRKVLQAAPTRATVLIHGETGTGKELIAAAVHQHSKRASAPFVRLNCAALAESVLESELFGHERGAFTGAVSRRKGRFEQADGGTLFLDEVSEIPPSVQLKLLRFLQEREFERVGGNETLRVDARIVAATNRDLKQLAAEGRFREDLYYRLNVVRLDVPPLRARPSDIPLLADHFLRGFAEENERPVTGLDAGALEALVAHPWPGNVRELQNAIEQAVVLCRGETVGAGDLPIAPAPADIDPLRLMIPGVTLAEIERYAIMRTLEACGNSPKRAAAILGISRRTIQYRLQQWGVTRPRERQGGHGEVHGEEHADGEVSDPGQ